MHDSISGYVIMNERMYVQVYGSVPVKEIALKGPDSDADAGLGVGVKRAVGVEINIGTGHDR
jgi:hypothetical protein